MGGMRFSNRFTVQTGDLADGSVTAVKLASTSVTTAKINALAVQAAQLDSTCVTTAKINALAIQAAQLDSTCVTTAKLNAGAVTAAILDSTCVTTAKINALAVQAAQLDSTCVTTAKINALAVQAAQLDSTCVTTAKINDGAVTAVKASTDLSEKTYRIGHTYAIPGTIAISSGDTDYINPFFVSVVTGQTAKLAKCRYRLNTGTNVTLKLTQNSTDALGFTGMVATTAAAETDPADVTLADNDLIALVVTATSGTPKNLSCTIFIDYLQ